MKTINIAKDYSRTPGSRFKEDGPYSGEEFRERMLEPHFKNPEDEYKIEIILDGTEGYATSFLEEAFGGLARKYGKERCFKRLSFISEEDEMLITEIGEYMENCHENK